MARKRLTFEQMKNDGREPERTNGLTCPKCGCGHLDANNSGNLPSGTKRRYRYCRNCGTGFETRQPPERIIREVKPHKAEDEEEQPVLKVRTA